MQPSKTTKSKIQLLPEHIIDQIKAGEVIERPSTLLKEIIENAIDAGSTKINIHLVNNGLDLISISDNGSGINADDLPLAFCRHATSKIDRFEDIYRLHSYGFRGEALASIASISRVTCETYTKNTYGHIKIDGAETLTHESEENKTNKTGTKFFIKDLFYNTPVRMKFIQSKTSEKNQLKKIINAFLLTHPDVEFSVQWDDKEKSFYPVHKEQKLKKRIEDVLFKGETQEFLQASNFYDGISFEVFLSLTSSRGNAHKSFYLFINDRYVQDIQMHKIILNSSSALWPEGESGNYVAFLNIPADEIDVNIHPNKTVVKLFKAPKAFSIISSTIKQQINAGFKPKQIPYDKEVIQTLPLDTQNESFKDLEYKKVDFSSGENLNNYFDNLHSPTPQLTQHPTVVVDNNTVRIIKNFESHLLILKEDQLYTLAKKDFVIFHLKKILSKKPSSDDIVPLLVSKPIKVDRELSEELKNSFFDFGFEIDQFDSTTIVLRTFPKTIQQFPYLNIAQELISQTQHLLNIEEINFETIDFSNVTEQFYINILKQSSIVDLLEKNIIKKISDTDIIKLHETK